MDEQKAVRQAVEQEGAFVDLLNQEMEELTAKATIKEVLEKVWDNTYEKEVGIRWILLQIAEEYGVKLDRRLKKYGTKNTK